jgi:hypothetical protein
MIFWDVMKKYRVGDGYEMPCPTQNDARRLAAMQPGLWANLIIRTIAALDHSSGVASIQAALDAYRQYVQGNGASLFKAPPELLHPALPQDDTSQDYSVRSEIPLLEESETAYAPPTTNPWPYVGVIFYAWSNLASSINPQMFEKGDPAFSDPRVQRAVAETACHFETDIDALVITAQEANRFLNAAAATFEVKIKEIDAAVSKAREDNVFQEARTLWVKKATEHTRNYSRGFVVVTVGVVAIASLVGAFGAGFWDQLPRNEKTGEYTYLATFIVGLAFLAIAWIFRMIGRFVMDNFTLAADARQRQTILETFLNLVGTAEAKMNEGERVLILSALFRAAPGQGSDDPAPASLLDLVKDATKAK